MYLRPSGDSYERFLGMRLTVEEQAHVQSQGLYLTERCDGCKTILNQSVTYTIAGKAEVYCSSTCRDGAYFEDHPERKKRANPGRCANCGGPLQGKKRDAIYCSESCRKRHSRRNRTNSAGRIKKSRTPNLSNQQLANPKFAVPTQSLRNRNGCSHGPVHAKSTFSRTVVGRSILKATS